MLREVPADGLDRVHESISRLALADLGGQMFDDLLPCALRHFRIDPRIGENFRVTFGDGNKNQDARAAPGRVQVLDEKLLDRVLMGA